MILQVHNILQEKNRNNEESLRTVHPYGYTGEPSLANVDIDAGDAIPYHTILYHGR